MRSESIYTVGVKKTLSYIIGFSSSISLIVMSIVCNFDALSTHPVVIFKELALIIRFTFLAIMGLSLLRGN
jgi:hypothetical protein